MTHHHSVPLSGGGVSAGIPAATLENLRGGPSVRLGAAGGQVDVALKGAQVLSWEHPALGSLLWCSPAARLDDLRPMRGGIPICWPWFGPHPTDMTLPAHGVARTAAWTIVGMGCEFEHAHVTLALVPATGPAVGLEALLDIRLDTDLRIALTTRNVGAMPVELTAALHTYLAIGDVADVEIGGVDGVPFIDKLGGGARRVETGALVIDREIDRIYATGGPVEVRDRRANRRLTVSSQATSAATVVWNPWIEKAARLGDMPPADYRRMLCVETAHAGDDLRTLAPGASLRLQTAISAATMS